MSQFEVKLMDIDSEHLGIPVSVWSCDSHVTSVILPAGLGVQCSSEAAFS